MHADNPLVLRTSLCMSSLSALSMIVDNDGMGVWFLSYVNGLGTYLLRYSEVKSAHPLSLDLFRLLDLSTSWLILVSDFYSLYCLPAFDLLCLLDLIIYNSHSSCRRPVCVYLIRYLYDWPCLFDSLLSAWLSDHWSFVSLSTLLTLSTWLAHLLVLLVESTLFLLDLFVDLSLSVSLTRSPSWFSAWLACLLDLLHLWLAPSMTNSVYWTRYLRDSSCQLDCLTCLFTQLAHLSQLSVYPPLSPSAWLACLLSVYLTHLHWLVRLLNSLRLLDNLVYRTTSSITLTGLLDLLWLSDYLVYLTHLACLTL
jgi:hypothetical protein